MTQPTENLNKHRNYFFKINQLEIQELKVKWIKILQKNNATENLRWDKKESVNLWINQNKLTVIQSKV